MNELMITAVCLVIVGLLNFFLAQKITTRDGHGADLRRVRHLRIVAFTTIPVGVLLFYLAGHWQILK